MGFNRNYLSWKTLRMCLRASVVELYIFGDGRSRALFEEFSRPHPSFPAIPAKSLGAALIDLQGDYAGFWSDKVSLLTKRRLKKATTLGYRYEKIAGPVEIDQIIAVNRSLSVRGGLPMDPMYFDQVQFEEILAAHDQIHVVKSPEGRIVAYALVPNIGDLWLVEYVLGHGHHLNSGMMYLLMTRIIEEKFELAKAGSNPQWIMYDTLLGASPGRRQFKYVLGFSPYWVRWRWRNTPDAAQAPSTRPEPGGRAPVHP